MVFVQGGFDSPAAAVCSRIFRVKFNGFVEVGDGVVVFVQGNFDNPAIVVCFRIFRVKFNGFVEVGDGIVVLT